jgi:hypothetical protein
MITAENSVKTIERVSLIAGAALHSALITYGGLAPLEPSPLVDEVELLIKRRLTNLNAPRERI